MGAPTGTVTFLFTDIEGSTRLWESAPDAMRVALARHDDLLRAAIEAHGGYVFATGGDGFASAFQRAGDAVAAATGAQAVLGAEVWPASAAIRVRMGVHTGEVEERGGNYFGPALNRAARLMALAHGGQVVCSLVTAGLVDGVELVDLGEYRMRDLAVPERVFQVGHARFPTLRSAAAAVGNLPAETSSFVGRDAELGRLDQLLDEARLVTLAGVGGVGKTRLALRAAQRQVGRHRDGVWWFELASTVDPDGVPAALLAQFGVAAQQGQSALASLVELLRSKSMLVVLDNCEHVLRATAEMVDTVLRSSPGLRILATSREGLAVAGEQIFAVPALSVAGDDDPVDVIGASEAVQLFVTRAAAAKPGFELTMGNAAAVAQVCRRLDGVALAIELAAARSTVFTPAELARRLDQRFRLLTGSDRRSVERHQTLRAAIDWSYNLLDEGERDLLVRLAVFTGGFDLAAAEGVGGERSDHGCDVVDVLASLVARSMVISEADDAGTRFRLLETIRQYAADELERRGASNEARAAHARYYADAVTIVAPLLGGPDEMRVEAALVRDLDNIEAALAWAVSNQDIDVAVRLIAACDGPEGFMSPIGARLRPHAATVCALTGAERHELYPLALLQQAWHNSDRGDHEQADRDAVAALAAHLRLGTEPNAYAAFAQGCFAMNAGRGQDAIAYLSHAEQLARGAGTAMLPWAVSVSGVLRWLFHSDTTDPTGEAAPRLAAEAVLLARASGSPRCLNFALADLALVTSSTDPETALAAITEMIERSERLDCRGTDPTHYTMAAQVLHQMGRTDDALLLLARVLDTLQFTATPFTLGLALTGIGDAVASRDAEGAALLHGAGTRLVPYVGYGSDRATELHDDAVRAVDAAIGPARREQLGHQGAGMSDSELIDLARERINRLVARSA